MKYCTHSPTLLSKHSPFLTRLSILACLFEYKKRQPIPITANRHRLIVSRVSCRLRLHGQVFEGTIYVKIPYLR